MVRHLPEPHNGFGDARAVLNERARTEAKKLHIRMADIIWP
jgi:hypothetical protein